MFDWLFPSKTPYQRGYRATKKLLKDYGLKWQGELKGTNDSTELESRLNEIQGRAFRMGFGRFEKRAEEEISELQARTMKLEKERERLKDKVHQKWEEYFDDITKRSADLEEQIKKQEDAVKEVQQKAETAIQDKTREQQEKTIVSYFFGLAKKLRPLLASDVKILNSKLPLYGFSFVALALFLGDVYVVFDLFSDLLGIQVGLPAGMAYIASSVVALVFLVLAEFGLQALRKRNKKTMRAWLAALAVVIGLLLFAAYGVIIIIPALEGKGMLMIDVLLRILFAPMIIAVVLLLEKIREKKGGFELLFLPIRIAVLSSVLLVFYLLGVIEYIWKFLNKSVRLQQASNKKETTEERWARESLKDFRAQLGGLEKEEQKSVLDRDQEVRERNQEIESEKEKYDSRIRGLKGDLELLRQGCEDAVLHHLNIPT